MTMTPTKFLIQKQCLTALTNKLDYVKLYYERGKLNYESIK